MSLSQKYNKSMVEKWCVRFKTRHPDGDKVDGVVTHVKPSFIVLREEWDFEFDGVVVLPKKVITSCRDGKYDRCSNQILRRNGAMKKLHSPRWLESCETLPAIVAALMRRDIWPAVEILANQDTDSAFYIGPITSVDDDRFFLRCYDAAGKWEKKYNVRFDEIFKIEFDSRYCKHFNGYMQSKTTM